MTKVKEFRHLKSYIYYSDLYDKFTVEECRRLEKRGILSDYREIKNKSKKEIKESKLKKELIVKALVPTALYFLKRDRYRQKAETIREWMDRDKAKDDLLDSAKALEGIQCLTCGSDMNLMFKDICDWEPTGKDRVLFMYECPNRCLPRRVFFDNGEERVRKPHLCTKCGAETEEKDVKRNNIITTTYTCSKCGYREKDTLDLNIKPKKKDPNFIKDREKFCLSDEEGGKYISEIGRLKNFSETLKQINKEADVKKKISGIKRLNIAQLRNALDKLLEKENYIKLDFSKPEIGREVIVNFTIQDNKEDRREYNARIHAQRIIKKKLEGTNWRLMSDGISYRLGILSGRLKAYDNDEDLLKIVKQ